MQMHTLSLKGFTKNYKIEYSKCQKQFSLSKFWGVKNNSINSFSYMRIHEKFTLIKITFEKFNLILDCCDNGKIIFYLVGYERVEIGFFYDEFWNFWIVSFDVQFFFVCKLEEIPALWLFNF
jgi:hypothetical protein